MEKGTLNVPPACSTTFDEGDSGTGNCSPHGTLVVLVDRVEREYKTVSSRPRSGL